MIKAVIFDIDGTLYDYKEGDRRGIKSIAEYCYNQFGITYDEFKKIHSYCKKYIFDNMSGNSGVSHNRLIRYQHMLEYWNKPIFPHALKMYNIYWNELFETVRPDLNLIEALKLLKEKDIIVGIGTNMNAYIQFEKLKKLEIDKYIDIIITSEEIGYEKPDKRFFDMCAKKSKCEASECIFIGDDLIKDVWGSENAGMKPLWYKAEDLDNKDDVQCITDYRELIEIIKQY